MSSKEIQLLGPRGEPIVRSVEQAPDSDPSFFWMTDDKNISAKDVVDKPFLHHVWTYRCVSVIARAVSQLERLLRGKKDGVGRKCHGVLSLLRRPNRMTTQGVFFETLIDLLMLPQPRRGAMSGGQCFVVPWNFTHDSKVKVGRGELPEELTTLAEDFFEPWFHSDDRQGRRSLRGWKFAIRQMPGTEIYFENDEIIRIHLVNPYDILKGLSPYSPVASAIEFDAYADLYNRGVFQNNGRLDGLVSTDETLATSELKKLKEEWLKTYTGTNRDRIAFLMGGLKYQQFALSSSDLQYIEQEKWSRQKVLGAYGLNRIGVGDYEEINYATIREGRKLLWYDTYIPLDKLILDAFNNQWISYIDGGQYDLASDYTKVPALQADMQERAKTGGMLVQQMRYPPSLASRVVELPLTEEDLAKWPHLDEPPAVGGGAPAIFSAQNGVRKDVKVSPTYGDDYIARVLDPGERTFKKDLDKYFVAQRNGIMDEVDRWERTHKAKAVRELPVVGAWEFLPDEIRENLELLKVYRPSVRNQMLLEKKQAEAELGHGVEWDVGDTRMQYWVNARSVYLEEINTTTFSRARDAIDETVRAAISEGKTVPELAKDVKQAVHDVYEVRLGRQVVPHGDFDLGGMSSSMTIARTEMGTVASLTRYDIFQSEGIEKIQWVTAGDEWVRESHVAVNDEVVQLGEAFSNGLRFPREQGAPPEEVINCRCAWVAISPND